MKFFLITLLIITLIINLNTTAFAHEGHIKTIGEEDLNSGNTILKLSDTAINNLGIQTSKAIIAPHATTIDINGIVELLPERQAVATSRTTGRVFEIYVKIGDKVSKGQNLLTIQPTLIGSSMVSISSPIDGYITKQNIILGQSVTPETELMNIGDSSDVLIKGIMYETPDIGKIKIGQNVIINSNLIENTQFNGKIQRIDNAYDSNNHTLNIYALVKNIDYKLLANMRVILSIETSKPLNILTVPVKAILGDNGEQFVFVKNGNEFERRNIKLGEKFGIEREVLEGVFPDEEIVTVGNYQLQFVKSSETVK